MNSLRQFITAVSESDGQIDFLQPDYLERAYEAIRLPDDVKEAFRAGEAAIRNNTRAADMARVFHRELFIEKRPQREVNERLLASGPGAAMMSAFVYLGALPQLMDFYASRKIPDRILVDTLQDMAIWMRHHRSRHGVWGLSQLGWLYHHWTGSLFQLGRLQFMFTAYSEQIKVFSRRETGEMIVLAESGVRYRADGQVDGTNGITDPVGGWTSAYKFDGAVYSGQRITADGKAVRDITALTASHWDIVLEKGKTVLDVHIPEGARMSHELCRDSYKQASAFAREHFPERPFSAFVCSSWLLAPQFLLLLPMDSNIVLFQRDYYITPVLSDEEEMLERVFGYGVKLADLPDVPRDTSLQRILFDYLASGGRIHGAAGFILPSPHDH